MAGAPGGKLPSKRARFASGSSILKPCRPHSVRRLSSSHQALPQPRPHTPTAYPGHGNPRMPWLQYAALGPAHAQTPSMCVATVRADPRI
mmetsp:Transcript_43773/g.72767  ORF Transcript_43773/g.72767 Transcript_43773/m.72767 type:complete len:90 (-) Transcript_43773:37-306(-)